MRVVEPVAFRVSFHDGLLPGGYRAFWLYRAALPCLGEKTK